MQLKQRRNKIKIGLINYLMVLFLLLFFYSCEKSTEPEQEEPEPTTINIGIQYSGSINSSKETQSYLLKPTASEFIHIVCTESIQYSEFNPKIRLIDYVSKQVLKEAANNSQAVIVNFNTEPAKVYEIQILDWEGTKTGGYRLFVEKDNDDGKELIKDQNISGIINYPKDTDDFILKIPDLGYYHISIKEKIPYSEFDPKIGILDFATKHQIAGMSHNSEVIFVNKNLGQNLHYWLRIQNAYEDKSGEYVITYMKDPDDSTTFTSTPVNYFGHIDYIKDVDKLYFKPSLSGDYKFVLSKDFPSTDYSPRLNILDQYGGLLQGVSSYDSCIININLESLKTYGIEIKDRFLGGPGGVNGGWGKYRFRIEKQ